MGRFLGQLSSDAFGYPIGEMKIAHYNIPAAQVVAADPDGLLDGHEIGAAASVVTTFLNDMPFAMNITMVCSGTQTGKATVYGTDMNDDPISEEFTLASTDPVVGAKAFKTVERIALPIKVASETIDVGWGGKFGLPYKLAADELVIVKLFNASADTGTVTVNATDLAKNVFDPTGTPDGEKPIDLYIIV